MASVKELRLRIKALKNSSKMTAALKMVSAGKLKKSQDGYNRNKPYYQRMLEMLDRVLASVEDIAHPLMVQRPLQNIRYYIIASDRGLCGGFNNNLFKTFNRRHSLAATTQAAGIGRRAREFVKRQVGLSYVAKEDLLNTPSYANAQAIANVIMADFLAGKCDEVILVFNQYKSVLSQVPSFVSILPFKNDERRDENATEEKSANGYIDQYFLEPDAASLFAELLPKLVTLQIFRAMLENAVGEHSARMTAMDSATKNTKELIGSYTLTANRLRQAAITRELIEIVSGAEALKG